MEKWGYEKVCRICAEFVKTVRRIFSFFWCRILKTTIRITLLWLTLSLLYYYYTVCIAHKFKHSWLRGTGVARWKALTSLLCFHGFCSQWQISTEVHWLSGLRSAKNKNKIRWTWLLLLRPSRLEHSSIRPSRHYWYEYTPKTTQECTFWSCLQLTIAGAPGRVV